MFNRASLIDQHNTQYGSSGFNGMINLTLMSVIVRNSRAGQNEVSTLRILIY